jgi:hypothetical protein
MKHWLDYFMEIFGMKRVDIVEKKKRGRPLGSKNKKKETLSERLERIHREEFRIKKEEFDATQKR